jgi:hypothetical protein
MCETVARVFAAPCRRPRARLLRCAPPTRARRVPPPRVVVAPRVAPPARRPPPSSWPTATATKKIYKRREGDDDARGGGSVHGHDVRAGTMRGGATRAGRRRGAQPHTECAPPIGHRPARTVVHLGVWALQSVDSQSESPQQESRRIPIQLSPESARLRVNNWRIVYFSARISRI